MPTTKIKAREYQERCEEQPMLDRIVYTDHGEEKRREEGLSTDDVRAVLERGLVLRRYPEDRPFPSRLVLGWIDGPARLRTYGEGRPIHVVGQTTPNAGLRGS